MWKLGGYAEGWRAKAMECFPELTELIETESQLGDLWIELHYRLVKAYSRQPINDDLIGRIYDYAKWCRSLALGMRGPIHRARLALDSLKTGRSIRIFLMIYTGGYRQKPSIVVRHCFAICYRTKNTKHSLAISVVERRTTMDRRAYDFIRAMRAIRCVRPR
jgi:hypothetical protein